MTTTGIESTGNASTGAGARRSELTERPNKRRGGEVAGGLPVAESRPQVVDGRLRGARCTACGHAVSQPDVPWCPVCFGEIEAAGFVPVGTVWAATTVHLPVGRWSAPFGLAYVDVDDGPRVLVHVRTDPLPRGGDWIEFGGSDDGDLVQLGVTEAVRR